MKALNKETAAKTQRPERIIQFGEGELSSCVCGLDYLQHERKN